MPDCVSSGKWIEKMLSSFLYLLWNNPTKTNIFFAFLYILETSTNGSQPINEKGQEQPKVSKLKRSVCMAMYGFLWCKKYSNIWTSGQWFPPSLEVTLLLDTSLMSEWIGENHCNLITRDFWANCFFTFTVFCLPFLQIKLKEEVVLTLINTVRSMPELWKQDAPGYRDLCVQQQAWNTIAAQFGVPVENLKEKWKMLRTQFRSNHSKVRNKRLNGSGKCTFVKYESKIDEKKQFWTMNAF